jgi:hypothetical protein
MGRWGWRGEFLAGLMVLGLSWGAIAAEAAEAAEVVGDSAIAVQGAIAVDRWEPVPVGEFWERLARSRRVFLGEVHNRESDRDLQIAVIHRLFQQSVETGENFAIGVEMVQQQFQPVVDQYLTGEIDGDDLRRAMEFDDRWGYDWPSALRLFDWAREHRVPVVALGAPTETWRKVVAGGFEALEPEDWRWLPAEGLGEPSAAWLDWLGDIYDQSHRDLGNRAGFGRFWQVQHLWDGAMAAAIAGQFGRWGGDRGGRMAIVVGRGHVIYGYGLPTWTARLLGGSVESEADRSDQSPQTVLLLAADGGESIPWLGDRAPADFVLSPAAPALP